MHHYIKEARKLGGAPPIPATYNASALVYAFPFEEWGGCPQHKVEEIAIGLRTRCMAQQQDER